MTQETITLASGEKRGVQFEATNDKEWADFLALAEDATALSLDQKEITHRTIAAIAALRTAHEDEWKPYCELHGMRWPKEAKSDFRPVVMWYLNQQKARTGENHTSKASMIAGALDEYCEIERPNGMTPDQIPGWLDEKGGYTGVYRKRLKRLKDPKDKIAERYGRFLKLKPLEQREIPDWLEGFAGEVVIAAHIDRDTGKLEYRSVWRPDGSGFWHGKLDQFIPARPDYGEAVEPVRVQREPMFDLDDRASEARRSVRSESQKQPGPSIGADVNAIHEIMFEEVGGTEVAGTELAGSQTEPQSRPEPAVAELNDQDDSTAVGPERSATDLGDQQDATEVQTNNALGEVGSEAAMGTPIACNLPSGCRYLACKEQGRCRASPNNPLALNVE